MQIYYATTNLGKFISLEKEFKGSAIEIKPARIEIPEPRSDDLKLIAREKVLAAYRQLNQPVVALDAGFFIHSLNGFPKAFANFALETIGIEGLVKLCQDKDKSCEFRSCLAYFDSSLKEPIYFEDTVSGTITEPQGINLSNAWSKLWLIFVPKGSKKTLAEMSEEERDQWHTQNWVNSHPQQLKQWLLKNRLNQ